MWAGGGEQEATRRWFVPRAEIAVAPTRNVSGRRAMVEEGRMLQEIVWKIGGEQGQGLDPTSDVFATVCNRMGYWVYAYKTFSSRIKGGHTDFTVRVSQERKLSPAPRLHMLV